MNEPRKSGVRFIFFFCLYYCLITRFSQQIAQSDFVARGSQTSNANWVSSWSLKFQSTFAKPQVDKDKRE